MLQKNPENANKDNSKPSQSEGLSYPEKNCWGFDRKTFSVAIKELSAQSAIKLFSAGIFVEEITNAPFACLGM